MRPLMKEIFNMGEASEDWRSRSVGVRSLDDAEFRSPDLEACVFSAESWTSYPSYSSVESNSTLN